MSCIQPQPSPISAFTMVNYDNASDISSMNTDPMEDSFMSHATASSSSSRNSGPDQELSHSLTTLDISKTVASSKYTGISPDLTRNNKSALSITSTAARSPHRWGQPPYKLQSTPRKPYTAFNGSNICLPPKVDIDTPMATDSLIGNLTSYAGFRMRGNNNGKQSAFQGQVSDSYNSGANAPNYPDHVKHPADWGSHGQRGNGSYDGDEDVPWGSGGKMRRSKKRFACPAAKGDPFRNRECLGVSFPNLAKTRQHLICSSHFSVQSTTQLPNEIRDPNAWNEIVTYCYPGKEIPSSDEDFHDTLDVIEGRGSGPGKPDFRSTLIRCFRRALQDPNHCLETIRQLEAIDPNHDDWCIVSPALTDFQTDMTATDYPFFTEPLSNPYSSPNSHLAPLQAFASTALSSQANPPKNTIGTGTGYNLSTFTSGNAGTTGIRLSHESQQQFEASSHAMDMDHSSPSGPDTNQQVDNGLPASPASGPSPDRQLQIGVRFLNSGQPYLPFTGNAAGFEAWVRSHFNFREFSFANYVVRFTTIDQTFDVDSIQQFVTAIKQYAGMNLGLDILPRSGPSRDYVY